jgi:hypothetical protein
MVWALLLYGSIYKEGGFMSMTSADLKSLLTLVYKLVFLSVGLYMVLSGRLGVDVFDTLSKAVGGLLGP